MDFINQLLAGFLQSFKAKNPKIYGVVITVLVLGYAGIQMAIGEGILQASSLSTQILQYVDIAMLALVGSKTSPFLSEYLNKGNGVVVQSTDDSWLAKLLDGFKLKSPTAYAIIAVALITTFVGITYALQFGLVPDGNMKLLMQIGSYLELAGIVLLGARTGQYLINNPPELPSPGRVNMQSASNAALYYD